MLDAIYHSDAQLEAFRADALKGLAQSRKSLPSRWLYDDRGSELFEEITRLPEYYPTRTETAMLREHAGEIAEFCGEGVSLFEYGAGAGIKTEILVAALAAPRLYVPIDIAGDFLDQTDCRSGCRMGLGWDSFRVRRSEILMAAKPRCFCSGCVGWWVRTDGRLLEWI